MKKSGGALLKKGVLSHIFISTQVEMERVIPLPDIRHDMTMTLQKKSCFLRISGRSDIRSISTANRPYKAYTSSWIYYFKQNNVHDPGRISGADIRLVRYPVHPYGELTGIGIPIYLSQNMIPTVTDTGRISS